MEPNERDYERYDRVSTHYDSHRVPAGLDALIGILSVSKVPLNEINLIDIGCGTGNYGVELAKHVNTVIGFDKSTEMIIKAIEKSRNLPNIEFYVDDAINMSIKNGKFDATLFILSLHHIGDFREQLQALEEAYRILKPQGVVVIQTLSQRQLKDGIWYHDLIPEATRKISERFIPIQDLVDRLNEMGFEYKGRIVPIDAVFLGANYLDVDGVFREEWRAAASAWKLATEDELANAQARVREMKLKGTIGHYIKKREELRKDLGQITYVYALKMQ